ncbi:MAG: fatty acid desaturase [Lentimicrobium sp.]|nr:fatty acid desaturase [Lentimicrobiaceae bacterium]MCO5264631.1 fatty acid desaturase [Lentimicrobium sp.]HPG33588.1 fatty acid desaturase [Lentimicrobium sp.]
MLPNNHKPNVDKSWLKLISAYKTPSVRSSIWQLLNTLIPYIGLWILMVYLITISWWLVLPVSILAAGFTVRLFIIFHDCGHGAFFKSKSANDFVGIILGILTFTPYFRWHHAHLIHHRTAGNLDKRGVGDVWTLTVDEYKSLSRNKRWMYRVYRNPLIMFGLGAGLVFLVMNRFTRKGFNRKERLSVYITNLGIAGLATGISLLIGLNSYLLIQIPVMYFAATAGVFLFYVQHQFPDVHWYRDNEWNYSTVAINGASYLKFPALLQWFSGNIGFHHIHHLSSKIPNYKLEKCHKENEAFQKVVPVTFLTSMKSLRLRLWDEERKQLVTYRQAAG